MSESKNTPANGALTAADETLTAANGALTAANETLTAANETPAAANETPAAQKDLLTEQTLAAFSQQLSAKVSVPGGGGAAAYAGALAASLGAMAANFTVGKKKFADVEEDLERIIADLDTLRLRFLSLVEEDAAAFEPLSAAYGIPKDDPARPGILREATLAAILPPYRMLLCCADTVDLLEELADKCSRLMISDAGCAAAAVTAAMESAWLNVLVNTRSLPGDADAKRFESEAWELCDENLPRTAAIYQQVHDILLGQVQ